MEEGLSGMTPVRFEFPNIEKKWYETKQNEKKEERYSYTL